MPFMIALSFVGLVVLTLITLVLLPVPQPMHHPATLLASVFAANEEASAQSTTYTFAFKTATSSSVKAVEITVPTTYGLERASYVGGSDVLEFSSFVLSGSKMKVSFQQPIHIPAGNMAMIEIGGINNPSTVGLHTFDIATIDSVGSAVESGSASIMLREPTILQTDHIQDEAVTTSKIADGSINLNKLAADVFYFFDEQFSFLQALLTDQMDEMRTELEDLIRSEESARVTANNELQDNIFTEARAREVADQEESSARAAEDQDLREEIDELRVQIKAMEEEN